MELTDSKQHFDPMMAAVRALKLCPYWDSPDSGPPAGHSTDGPAHHEWWPRPYDSPVRVCVWCKQERNIEAEADAAL